ncbi:MAG: sulfatase-like hydrolase/transferase, partial [Verrucomicrobiota bacterium]
MHQVLRSLLALFLVTSVADASTGNKPTSENSSKRPNVLVILVDDLGYSDLGCFGGEIETPNLDRLATGGSRFTAFYNSARCCPSRASLMTGLHPHEAGIGSFATATPRKGWGKAYTGHLLPDTATLAELLGDAGYSTWMVGKWHMGVPGPIARGFDHYYGYQDFRAYAADQWEPREYVRLPDDAAPEFLPSENFYATDVFNDYALAFIREARQKNQQSKIKNQNPSPWFLYLSHSSPHFPIQAPKESIDKYMETYRKGWDVLRKERLQRMKRMKLVPKKTQLPPLSEVPIDRDDIANGYSGKLNPEW